MSRKGRYVKPCERVYAPTAVVSVNVSTRPAGGGELVTSTPTVFRRGYTLAARRVRGQWTRPQRCEWSDEWECIKYIEEWSRPRQRTYCFAPVASDALTLLRFWELIDARGTRWERSQHPPAAAVPDAAEPNPVTMSRLVLKGKPDIVSYTSNHKTIVWTSSRQYFDMGLHDLANAVGYDWPVRSAAGPGVIDCTRHPADVAELWLVAVQRLADWWLSVGGGPWGLTVGQLADRYFRKRLAPRVLCSHGDDDARRLELYALHGGRASTWFYGPVVSPDRPRPPDTPPSLGADHPAERGPAVQYDVRSMYPHLLGDRPYPVKLLSYREDWTVKQIEELLPACGVIAAVQMSTPRAEYPYRASAGIQYPTGDFATVLAGPELERAVRGGDIHRVTSAAVYQLGRPFRTMAAELIQLRADSRTAGNAGWELFVKLLSNTFSGKLAQRRGSWLERPNIPPPFRWGEESWRDADTGVNRRLRVIAGLVFEWEDNAQAGRPLGFAYAYLTSYGRCMMRAFREACPWRSVVSQDTDGIWVLPDAVPAIETALPRTSAIAGELRRVGATGYARWYGPKHYWTEAGWTLSGLHEPARSSDGLTFADSYSANPVCRSPSEPPCHVWHVSRMVKLARLPRDGAIGPSGWIDPPALLNGRRR